MSSTNMIQLSNTFDPSSVVFSKMKKNKNGGKTVYINTADGKGKLYLQLPFMRSPYGLSAFTDETTNKTSYSLDLSIDPDNELAVELAEKLKQLDTRIIETVAANSKEWLGKVYNPEVMKEALYKPLVRPGKEDYPDTIKLKVMTKPTGEFMAEAYNPKQELVPIDSIEKGQRCLCIVNVTQIWFIDNKFGVSLRLSQALFQQSTKLPSFAFQGVETSVSRDAVDEGAEEEYYEEECQVDE